VRTQLRGIQDERQRIKGLQDEAYQRMVGARNEQRGRSRTWGDNRCVLFFLMLESGCAAPHHLTIGAWLAPAMSSAAAAAPRTRLGSPCVAVLLRGSKQCNRGGCRSSAFRISLQRQKRSTSSAHRLRTVTASAPTHLDAAWH